MPREPASSVDGLPTTAMLSQVLVAFAIDYEKERRGPIQWAASILRGIDRDGVDFPPLQKSGTSSVPNLERLGIVTVDRDNVVRLTARGRVMHDAYEPLRDQIEARSRHRLASSLIDEVVAAGRVEGNWRPFPLITWTGAEFSVLGGGRETQETDHAGAMHVENDRLRVVVFRTFEPRRSRRSSEPKRDARS